MEKTYTIGSNPVWKEKGFGYIDLPQLSDGELHDWVLSVFQNHEIDKLILELDSSRDTGLKIALHIRLSIEILKAKSLIPILFVSQYPMSRFASDDGTSQWFSLMASNGIFYSSYQDSERVAEMMEGIAPAQYKPAFLNIIKILPDESIGRHSLANIWGAYSIDRSARTKALDNDANFLKNKADLYFKFVSAHNFDVKKLEPSGLKVIGKIDLNASKNAEKIEAAGKRVLLIDDEADKGWETVLRKVFKTKSSNDFVIINEKVGSYEELSEDSRKIIEEQEFDLYLLDLRLNGQSEEEFKKAEEFSGMKVLKRIKDLNSGNQVIIFTASNKVWNLKKLMERGADGYYIKESPEYNFPEELTYQNFLEFKEEVVDCLNKGYLREFVSGKREIVKVLESKNLPEIFLAQIKKQLDLVGFLIKEATSREQFAFAFVSLCFIIEMINNQFISGGNDETWNIIETGELLDWGWNSNDKAFTHDNVVYTGIKPAEWKKFAGLYLQKWDQTDHEFIEKVKGHIQKRNRFIHSSKGQFSSLEFMDLFQIVKTIIGWI